MEVSLEKKLDLIDKIGFFARFTPQDRVTMANMASFRGFGPGQKLIEQNSTNSHLYFVINGNVDIVIDGEVLVSLYGGGHVFGEMSFVDFHPSSASVVARTKVVTMVFNTSEINLMIEPEHYRLRMEIYRSCAEILSRRLSHTNGIAKSHVHKDADDLEL